MPRPYLIGIAGPSGSGKTSIAKSVADALGGQVFPLDSYYHDLSYLPLEERRKTNFDHPDSLDSRLLSEHLRALAEGNPIDRPSYDFATHTRSKKTERVIPGDYLVVEGIFTLNFDHIRPTFHAKIFVEADHGICFERRRSRDLAERGYSEDYIRNLYEDFVRPMTDQFLLPTRVYADLIVDGCAPVEESAQKVLEHVRAHYIS